MSEENSVVCIMCPLGCEVKVEVKNGEILKIKGNACKDGEEYARQEISSPSRTVMSVVRCDKGNFPTVSVKTSEPIDKEKIEEVMKELRDVKVEAPVMVGDVIVENICDLGVDIVATRNVKKTQE